MEKPSCPADKKAEIFFALKKFLASLPDQLKGNILLCYV
jgi:hypothetical protein